MSVYWFLLPMIIIWFPFVLGYIWCAIGFIFFIMELIGKYGMKLINYTAETVEDFFKYKTRLQSQYMKIAMILSYILLGIMVLCKLLNVEID